MYYPNQGYTSNPNPVPIMNSANNFNSDRQPYPPPPMGPMAPMAQPVPVTAGVVVNQVPMTTITANTSSPFATTCPYCKKGITTVPTKTCNCMACIFCYFTACLLYFCIQCCRGKDCCCYDAIHKCPSCGSTIAQYNAC